MFAHLKTIDTKAHLDKQYYNVSIRYQDNPTGETICEFQEDRDVPILNKPNDWYMAISRFTVNGRSIPIFIMDRIVNPGDPTDSNFTPYTVTLTYYNLVGPNLIPAYFEENVIYVPENSYPVPTPPTATSTKEPARRGFPSKTTIRSQGVRPDN